MFALPKWITDAKTGIIALFNTAYAAILKPADLITKGPWVDVRSFNATSGNSAATNTPLVQAAINSISSSGGLVLVPAGINYNAIIQPQNVFIVDLNTQQIVMGGIQLGAGALAKHVTLRSKDANDASRLYIMPRGTANGTTAALKLFSTDYEADGVNYQDFGIYHDNTVGAIGTFFLNSKANGNKTNAPVSFSFQDGARIAGQFFQYTATDAQVVAALALGGTNPAHTNMYSGVGCYFVKDAAFNSGGMLRWYGTNGAATNGFRFNGADQLEAMVGGAIATRWSTGGQRTEVRTVGTQNDATPSVAGINYLQVPTAAVPYNITDFINGYDGQELDILFSDPYVTVIHDAGKIILNGGSNFTSAQNALLTLKCTSTKWVEKSRGTQLPPLMAGNLSDYAVPTAWTPVLTFTTPGNLSVGYTTQFGRYMKFGKMVIASFTITTSSFTWTTASGALNITGLPFTSNSATGYVSEGALRWQGITKAGYTGAVCEIGAGVQVLRVLASGSGQAVAAIAAADMPSGGSISLVGTITYFTD